MPLDASRLTSSLSEGEHCRRTLRIRIPSEQVSAEETRLIRDLSGRVRLPGFRSGRIPEGVLRKRLAGHIQKELVDRLVGDAYKLVLEQESLRPISEGEVEEIHFHPGEDLTFAIGFDVAPQPALERISGFEVQRPRFPVGDAQVDEVLERLRGEQGAWEAVASGTPEDGDLASVRVTNLDVEGAEPRTFELVLGGGDALPQVEQAIRTLEPGTEGEFTIQFPEDHPEEERRGASQRLRIALAERKRRILPALDDAFAASVGDFDSLDALRTRVREDLEREAAERGESILRADLLDQIIEANPFEVPRSMVLNYIRTMLGGGEDLPADTMARAREALGSEAERAIRRILVIEQVAEREGLRATEDEIDARIEAIAERNGTDPGTVYAQLQKAGRLQGMEREIMELKVFGFLTASSTILDAA